MSRSAQTAGCYRDPTPLECSIVPETDGSYSVDLRDRLGRVVQRGMGCAPAAACMGLSLQGIRPSWTTLYALARQLVYGGSGKLPDIGTTLENVVRAMEQWGLVTRTEQEDLRRPVTLNDLDEADDARLADLWRAPDAYAIRWALRRGYAVLYASDIGPKYREGPAGGTYYGDAVVEPIGHARIIVGCRPGAFLEANPWGATWDRWVSESVFEDGSWWGGYVLHAVRRSPSP